MSENKTKSANTHAYKDMAYLALDNANELRKLLNSKNHPDFDIRVKFLCHQTEFLCRHVSVLNHDT